MRPILYSSSSKFHLKHFTLLLSGKRSRHYSGFRQNSTPSMKSPSSYQTLPFLLCVQSSFFPHKLKDQSFVSFFSASSYQMPFNSKKNVPPLQLKRNSDSSSLDSQEETYFISPRCHPPRYPIVLCHGLFGFDKMGYDAIPLFQIYYWRGIASKLRDIGCKVFEARVPGTGSIADRAMALKLFVEAHRLTDVNFVAHSMGGLDCRYLIAKLTPSFRVHSLTTISTPHRGSAFMEWCSTTFGVGKARPLPYLPIAWLDFPAYSNLTTTYCQSVFNVEVQDQVSTSYFSYGAHYRIPFWSPLWYGICL
ncbi:hypothetical protein HMI54_005817 [Coelomomyces lativittatus]|nr:hypothetical protein HMI56_002292 [Coelomomyces lativittatus]KAJ1505608.1 hypothetical protein HMI54_005817 [Coelomomyces lativittatus]